jgi:hypothetical protein
LLLDLSGPACESHILVTRLIICAPCPLPPPKQVIVRYIMPTFDVTISVTNESDEAPFCGDIEIKPSPGKGPLPMELIANDKAVIGSNLILSEVY